MPSKRYSLMSTCAVYAVAWILLRVCSGPTSAAEGGNVTGWGGTVLHPLNGYGARLTRIAAGSHHNLAVTSDGKVVAWAHNGLGQCNVPTGLDDVVAVAAGRSHSLALKSDGTVVGWGTMVLFGSVCALADSSTGPNTPIEPDFWYDPPLGPYFVPVTVPSGLHDVVAIAAGGNQSLALKSDGTVVAWGYREGQSSDGPCRVPSELRDVVAIAVGDGHSLALKGDGTVAAWGSNGFGQCDVPSGLSGVVAIAAGDLHSLALKADGTVVTWGVPTDGSFAVPPGLRDVVSIAIGPYQSLALKSDGTVVAWGSNSYGQCDVPAGLNDVVEISAGIYSLALKADGTVASWGTDNSQFDEPGDLSGVVAISVCDNHRMALQANGTVIDSNEKRPPSGLRDVVAIAAGKFQSLALQKDGTVVAWGWNLSEECNVPVGLRDVAAIAAAAGRSLALKRDGTVVAWGSGSEADVPIGLHEVVAISAASSHVLALTADGTVRSWGWHGVGELSVPAGLGGVIAIAAGESHNLALKSDGTVVAWGGNESGQCNVPGGLVDVVSIAAPSPGAHSLALKRDGTVIAWGDNTVGECNVPPGLNAVTAIAAGFDWSMALFGGGASQPPVASVFRLAAFRNTAANLSIFTLLQACTDPDWDTFIISGVSPESAAGGLAQISGNSIIYSPPSDFAGEDSFAYTVCDSRGASTQGTVLVTVSDATSIPTLFNTGVNETGAVLNDGTIGDPHYTLRSLPGGTPDLRVRTSIGGWPVETGVYIGDNSLSAWIGPNNHVSLDGPVGTYVYRTTFDLCGFDPSTAQIAGRWSKDDFSGDIQLNGVSIGNGVNPDPFFYAWAPFTIASGFIAGINTLDFSVDNEGGPTALRVEMTARARPAPVAGTYEMGASRNEGAVLPTAKLQRGCGGRPTSAVTIVAVSPASVAGGAVQLNGTSIIYTPPSDFIGADSFTYTVRDSRGATAQGIVHVTVAGPLGRGPNILAVTLEPGGSAIVRCAGIPGELYSLEASVNLVQWDVLSSTSAGLNGLFQFTDSEAGQFTTRYYRTRYAGSSTP